MWMRGTSTLIEGLSSPQGLALLGDQLLIVDSGSKELIAVSLGTKQRQTLVVELAGRCLNPALRRSR